MFYTIYKITNLLDGKIYIGKHQTQDLNDGYMGSGKHLKRAQAKHGIENFKKEILFQFDNEAEMNAKESELVTKEFCLQENTYNLCPGGKGGWGYLNTSGKSNTGWKTNGSAAAIERCKRGAESFKKKLSNDQAFKDHYLAIRPNFVIAGRTSFLGKSHNDETKRKIGEINSQHQSGSKNSQFGTMWITDGQTNKKIKKIDIIPEGWYKGRK